MLFPSGHPTRSDKEWLRRLDLFYAATNFLPEPRQYKGE